LEKKSKTSPLIERFCMVAAFGVFVVALGAAPILAQSATPPAQSQKPAASAQTPGENEAAEALARHGDGVAAIVNDSVISDYDLRQRTSLYLATSGAQPSAEDLKHIREQILSQLENERLQLLEAQKNNITVTSAEVDDVIGNIMKENNLTKEKLDSVLGHNGVHIATLRSQIAAQIAWEKVVDDQYGDRVRTALTPEQVDREMQSIAQSANKPHFEVAEIFQAVDTPEEDAKVLKNMQDLETQLQMGAPFVTVARQFSQSPSAAQGGDLGWIQEGQLAPELDAAIQKLRPGEATPPVRSAGGYFILELRERQEAVGTKIPDSVAQSSPDGTLPLARILLPIGTKPTKELAERAMQAAAQLRSGINGCEHLQQLVARLPGAVYMNLGTMKLSDLAPEIQGELAKTEGGEATEPFGSPAGIEIIVRCDKAVPKVTAFVMPTRDAVGRQLYEEHISVYRRQYLRDLHRNADIELPGEGLAAHHPHAEPK